MADQRSVMKEYRLLEQKRLAGGLSPQEEARFAQLGDLVGSDAGGAKPGFDVNAAAARLRESLLPAGLRNRPPPAPEVIPEPSSPPEPSDGPAAEPPTAMAAGLEAAWSEGPFAPLSERSGLSAEALFDPATLGTDAPTAAADWDVSAQPDGAGWDPNAQPYDPNAPQQWDAGAQPWDPNAQPYDPSAPQQWDASAQPWDPNAQPYDPSAPQQWDASAQPWDPNAQPYDPNAPQQWDAGAQPWDPNAQPYDPNAPQQWDAGAQPWDTDAQPQPAGAEAQWSAEPGAEAAPAEGAWATGAEPLDAGTGLEPSSGAAGEPQPWETEAPAAELTPGLAAEPGAPELQGWEASAPPAGASDWDATALPPEEQQPGSAWDAVSSGEAAPPAGFEPAFEPIPEGGDVPPLHGGGETWPEPAPEESNPPPVEAAPIEPAVAAPTAEGAVDDFAVDVGELAAPEAPASAAAWGTEEPSFDVELAEPPPEQAPLADGDLAQEPPAQVDALPREEAESLLAPLAAGQELTSDDDAFAQGFHLESNGSFGSAAAPTAPAWTGSPAPAGNEDWESAPSLDLGAMSPAGAAPRLELAAPVPPPAPLAGVTDEGLEEIDAEEIPVVEGSELLEELPAAPPAAGAVAEPLPPPAPAAKPPPPPAHAAPPSVATSAAALRVEGAHRVVVHTVEGQVKRGIIADASLDAATLALAPQPDAPTEAIPAGKVKAIFFMLGAGEKAPAAEGKKVRVTFTDGRQIAGFSPDYTETGPGFFMIPADTRTNTGRIWVYRTAVKSVSVS